MRVRWILFVLLGGCVADGCSRYEFEATSDYPMDCRCVTVPPSPQPENKAEGHGVGYLPAEKPPAEVPK